MRGRMCEKGIATVVRDIQPLVAVSRPRIRGVGAEQQMSKPLARVRPQAERTVNVDPGSVLFRDRDQDVKPVERPYVDVARLKYHDRRLTLAPGQSVG